MKEKYQLTPKGFLSVETGMYEEFNKVWNKLIKFVEERAIEKGYSDGFPCLILKDGGYCITVTKGEYYDL